MSSKRKHKEFYEMSDRHKRRLIVNEYEGLPLQLESKNLVERETNNMLKLQSVDRNNDELNSDHTFQNSEPNFDHEATRKDEFIPSTCNNSSAHNFEEGLRLLVLGHNVSHNEKETQSQKRRVKLNTKYQQYTSNTSSDDENLLDSMVAQLPKPPEAIVKENLNADIRKKLKYTPVVDNKQRKELVRQKMADGQETSDTGNSTLCAVTMEEIITSTVRAIQL
ncbi:hypothetical protein RN001_015175 [Aquatica leii]|uniref:Uncharacterized protein n=1 Tax=Aquatica leii TaxID=1421715 RepID=A0AAN7P0N4_9COLE|nr:hypothetical protein RN001_015175 [Aquatica leii]